MITPAPTPESCNQQFSTRTLDPANSFAAHFPDLCNEWHHKRNGNLKPEMFFPYSKKSIWWICRFGHEWQTKV